MIKNTKYYLILFNLYLMSTTNNKKVLFFTYTGICIGNENESEMLSDKEVKQSIKLTFNDWITYLKQLK